ncbi:MAG: peptidylprolyl isomerase [Proteobacteria bacterium]|nr:peptidylprolyl isomerase [Pseudomonadota bacterium]
MRAKFDRPVSPRKNPHLLDNTRNRCPQLLPAAALRPYIDRINFEDVAKKHSIAPEAKEGGIVGPLRRDQLPTFFDSVFDMQIGEISGIVKSEYGFHIMMPVERLNASVVAYQEAKKLITKKLEAQKRGDLYLSWLKEAMNTIPVQSRNGENPQ